MAGSPARRSSPLVDGVDQLPQSSVARPVEIQHQAWQVRQFRFICLLAEGSALRSASLAFYGAQLLANAAWSWLFFGRKQIGAALADIVLLIGLITVTIGLFAQVSTLAAWLMVPYWLWVALALALNATILRLNSA